MSRLVVVAAQAPPAAALVLATGSAQLTRSGDHSVTHPRGHFAARGGPIEGLAGANRAPSWVRSRL